MKQMISAMVILGLSSASGAGQPSLVWPQFRGANGSGVADAQKPPLEFGPNKNVKWKVAVPSGMSSPIVAGTNLVLTAYENGKLYTIAYNRDTGKEAWRAEAPAKKIEKFHKKEGSPAASTPATDGKRIVCYFGSCGLLCYDLAGKELWRFDLPTASIPGNFGSGVSPILVDDTVVLVRDVITDAKILAIDATNGKLKWEQKRHSIASYGTPVVFDTPKGKQIVAPGHARLIAYDLKTGDERWSVAGIPSSCCSSPVVADGLVLFAGTSPDFGDKDFSFDAILKFMDKNKDGVVSKAETEKTDFYDFFDNQDTNMDGKLTRDEWDAVMKFMMEGKNAAFAVKPGGSGDVSGSHVVWKKTKGLPYVPSAIAYRGQYIMVKDGGMVTAYDAKTGKEIYVQQRVAEGGQYYATPVAANGHVYVSSLLDGAITVFKAGPKPEVVANNPPLDERLAATPAIADDTLYVRTAGHLYAFGKKQ